MIPLSTVEDALDALARSTGPRRRRRRPRERGRRRPRRARPDGCLGRLDRATHVGLPLRAGDGRDRRPAGAAAHGRRERRPPRHRLHGHRRRRRGCHDGDLRRRPGADRARPRGPRLDGIRPAPSRPPRPAAGTRRRRARAARAHRGRRRPLPARRPPPVGVIGELVEDDGSMTRMPGVVALAAREGLPVLAIADLVAWRQRHDRVERVADTVLPTRTAPSAPSGTATWSPATSTSPRRARGSRGPGAARAGALRVPHRRRPGLPALRLRPAAGPLARAGGRRGRGGRLPARARGPRRRPRREAARLRAPGRRPRHGRRPARARPARRRPRVRRRGRNPRRPRAHRGAPAHEQPGQGRGTACPRGRGRRGRAAAHAPLPTNARYLRTKRDRMGTTSSRPPHTGTTA